MRYEGSSARDRKPRSRPVSEMAQAAYVRVALFSLGVFRKSLQEEIDLLF